MQKWECSAWLKESRQASQRRWHCIGGAGFGEAEDTSLGHGEALIEGNRRGMLWSCWSNASVRGPDELQPGYERGPGTLPALFPLIIRTTYINIPILQRREVRFREVKSLVLNHTVEKQKHQDMAGATQFSTWMCKGEGECWHAKRSQENRRLSFSAQRLL